MSENTPKKNKLNLTEEIIRKAAENAANETNAQLDIRISSMTKLTLQEVKNLFPKKADKQKLDELIMIVKSEMNQQEKINAIVDKSERFAGIIISLLGRIL